MWSGSTPSNASVVALRDRERVMVVTFMLDLCCRDYPLLFETFNMPAEKSIPKLKLSTAESSKRGESPRVAVVLQSLDSARWTQSSLAEAAGVNRGVLNQLWKGKTSSSPLLIGRLVAVLPKKDAACLLTAYLEDVLAAVAMEESAAPSAGRHGLQATLKVSFPPSAVDGAA
jgi:DNA-binding XRE family transcriptional regulator